MSYRKPLITIAKAFAVTETIDGHLATSVPDVQVASLPSDTPDRGVDCEWPDGPATGGCDETSNVDRLLTLFEPSDSEF